jgi:hypothetical protein
MRVLLVEDHQELAETVFDVLRGEGIADEEARDGRAALDRSTVNGYDVAHELQSVSGSTRRYGRTRFLARHLTFCLPPASAWCDQANL